MYSLSVISVTITALDTALGINIRVSRAKQYCFQIDIENVRHVLCLEGQGSDIALWMNVIMTCTLAGGMLVYVLVHACAPP